MATVVSKRKAVEKNAPATYESIAARAYELYLLRGGVEGFALEDWLTAESELSVATTSARKRASKKDVAVSISARDNPQSDKPAKAPRQRKTTSAPTKKSRS